MVLSDESRVDYDDDGECTCIVFYHTLETIRQTHRTAGGLGDAESTG